MGKMNDVLYRYLSDRERFADFFNAVFFNGRSVVDAMELTEASEQYFITQERVLVGQSEDRRKYISRVRDLKKSMKIGGSLRILAIENQNLVDYSMPFRCMEYDILEYRKQLEEIHKENEKNSSYITSAERLCRVKKTDRLYPVYTVCLYHGETPWDGPRTLKDMMKFDKADPMEEYFADYPMRLYCVNEEHDFSMFHTELKALFHVMQYRRDKKKLLQVVEEYGEYRHLSEDTLEAIATVMDEPAIWKNRDRYRNEQDKEEEYNMCQAWKELLEDERNAGRAEGKAEGKVQGIELTNKLIQMLLADGREEDLMMSTQDALFRQKLFEEYEIYDVIS